MPYTLHLICTVYAHTYVKSTVMYKREMEVSRHTVYTWIQRIWLKSATLRLMNKFIRQWEGERERGGGGSPPGLVRGREGTPNKDGGPG